MPPPSMLSTVMSCPWDGGGKLLIVASALLQLLNLGSAPLKLSANGGLGS
jgi:hypothetical protein